eukprot:CAMPEP_0194487058 /NCGR_PEP_ID=MMETSP0253-20130528/7483_1 /TAXON_ID=2966 /ORGANISM="Noctiluca scintillans" /LENGTH=190 /DNA_ID=CAMNT_0039327229 /DNA_START=98 /DNA_END=670 /DNA_ORIENTATION=-
MSNSSAFVSDCVEPSVFESKPKASQATVTCNAFFSPRDSEKTTFESIPCKSKADTSQASAAQTCSSECSTFESKPARSRADVRMSMSTKNVGELECSSQPSVFESVPKKSTAAAKCHERVSLPTLDQFTFENIPGESSAAVSWRTPVAPGADAAAGQSVFESVPKASAAFAKSGLVRSGSDSEYTTDDDE